MTSAEYQQLVVRLDLVVDGQPPPQIARHAGDGYSRGERRHARGARGDPLGKRLSHRAPPDQIEEVAFSSRIG
jgi:hypothetical protein